MSGEAALVDAEPMQGHTLIFVGQAGEGGGDRFMQAAITYQSEHGGEIFEVSSGAEMVDIMGRYGENGGD